MKNKLVKSSLTFAVLLITFSLSLFADNVQYPLGINPDTEKPPVVTDEGWEELSNDDGIRVQRKSYENSPILAFRGTAVVEASISKVAQVLIDTTRKLEWVANSLEARNVRDIGERGRIEYNRTHTPWPVTNRDFVFYARILPDKANKILYLSLNSVEDPAVPETKNVRGNIIEGFYVLKSLENDTKTHTTVQIQVDPKGAIPKWLANLTQKSWPRKTVNGIRNQVKKPDVGEHEGVKKLLFGPDPAPAAPVVAVAPEKPAEEKKTVKKAKK